MAKKTYKSSKGTITNVIQNKDGSKTIQVKDKDGKYFENTIKPEISFSEDITNRANNLARQANNSSLGWDINEQEKNGHFIKAGTRPKQSIAGKIGDVIYNPFTAIGHFIRGQKIPDYLQESIDNGTYGYYDQIGRYQTDRSIFDIIADLGPIGYSHAASDILDRMVNKPSDLTSGENVIDVLSVLTPYLKISSSKPRFNLSKSTSNLPALNYQFGIRPASINQFNPSGLTKELLVNAAGYGNFQNGGIFDGGGNVRHKKINKQVQKLTSDFNWDNNQYELKDFVLNTSEGAFNIAPKTEEFEGEGKSYYDKETGTIYLNTNDLENKDLIQKLNKEHEKGLEYAIARSELYNKANKNNYSFEINPSDFNPTKTTRYDSETNRDVTKGVNVAYTPTLPFNLTGNADFTIEQSENDLNKVNLKSTKQSLGYNKDIGNINLDANLSNSVNSDEKFKFNPDVDITVTGKNFSINGSNSFQKDENGKTIFEPNLDFNFGNNNASLNVKHQFVKDENGKYIIVPNYSGKVKKGNWTFEHSVNPTRNFENNIDRDFKSSIKYNNKNFNVGVNAAYTKAFDSPTEFNSGNFDISYNEPINKNLNLNISGSNQFKKEDLINPELNLGINYGRINNPVSFNIGNRFKEGALFNPTLGFRYNFADGGPAKKELPDDFNDFLNFHKTLPENLQDPTFEYGNPNQYDLYGFWESLGKAKDFNQAVKDNPYWQPDPEDGMYHGFSVNATNGVFLKPANHPTTYKEVMMASLNTDPYFKEHVIIMNEDGRLQYVPRK